MCSSFFFSVQLQLFCGEEPLTKPFLCPIVEASKGEASWGPEAVMNTGIQTRNLPVDTKICITLFLVNQKEAKHQVAKEAKEEKKKQGNPCSPDGLVLFPRYPRGRFWCVKFLASHDSNPEEERFRLDRCLVLEMLFVCFLSRIFVNEWNFR